MLIGNCFYSPFQTELYIIGCTLVSLLPPPRLLYALSQDGLICSIFATVNEKTGVPVIGTLSCGIFVGECRSSLVFN